MNAASVDAVAVKELRDLTGAGIMDCKAALKESGGDLAKATDFLRKKGLASAAKRAGREAKEGLIVVRVEASKAVIAEVNCETDFVARTDDFKGLAALALDETLAHGAKAVESAKITDRVAELSGKIGEKILVKRVETIESANAVFSYVHSNQKLGVLVEIATGKPETRKNPALEALGKDVAMQVAASNPVCVERSGVPAATLDREKAIYREEVKGKPENILEKIVEGKLAKFYQTACLLEQPFIKDDKQSVQKLVEETGRKLGDTLRVVRFVRFQLGEKSAA